MFRNLNTVALGITGRQSELIELALTYGFGGLDLNMSTIARRARNNGVDQAKRFVASAGLRIGEFALPVEIVGDEAAFRSGLAELTEVAQIAEALEAYCCRFAIQPVSREAPYHEFFEMHRQRLTEVAEVLANHNVRLGLAFTAAPDQWKDAETAFIHEGEALMTLIRTIGKSNVGVALDIWEWVVGGSSVEQFKQIPGESISSVRLADLPAEASLESVTEQDRVLPGEGGPIDCRAVVQHLKGCGYEGPLTLYPAPSQFTGMTREAIVQQARAAFDDLLNPAPVNASSEQHFEGADSVSAENA